MAEQKVILTASEIKEDPDQIAKYDPEMRFRQLTGMTAKLVFAMTIILSIFHIYTAGFGVLQEWRHRAFHLAFVLPLVFFVYAMKKEVHLKGGKHLIYDVLYAVVAAMLNTAIFREILGLSFGASAAMAAATFALVLYFKQRENLPDRLALYVDFPIYTAMIGFILYGIGLGWTHLDVRSWFEDLNPELVFWGIFLLGIFLAIIALFFLNWVRALLAILRDHKAADYRQDNIPYFDVFFALMACMISVFVFLEFNNIGMRAGSPDQAELVVGSFSFLLILEGARRSIGAPLPIIAMLVLINCYLGPYFLDIPGLDIFAHRGYRSRGSSTTCSSAQRASTDSHWGSWPLSSSTSSSSGSSSPGRGSPSSSWTSPWRLPAGLPRRGAGEGCRHLQRLHGFHQRLVRGQHGDDGLLHDSPDEEAGGFARPSAGAVEAAASTGGQIMPPIMGAAALIMAEFLGFRRHQDRHGRHRSRPVLLFRRWYHGSPGGEEKRTRGPVEGEPAPRVGRDEGTGSFDLSAIHHHRFARFGQESLHGSLLGNHLRHRHGPDS